MKESAKVYREIFEILKYIPSNEVTKLPSGFLNFIEKNMDKTYIYKIENIQEFDKQEMLQGTRVILAILYRDYWATPARKKEIIERDYQQIKEQQEIERKKYDIETILAKKREETEKSEPKLTDLVPYKEGVVKRFINRIRKWLKI